MRPEVGVAPISRWYEGRRPVEAHRRGYPGNLVFLCGGECGDSDAPLLGLCSAHRFACDVMATFLCFVSCGGFIQGSHCPSNAHAVGSVVSLSVHHDFYTPVVPHSQRRTKCRAASTHTRTSATSLLRLRASSTGVLQLNVHTSRFASRSSDPTVPFFANLRRYC